MARDESLLISEELFRALSPVSGDLDWDYIWPNILVAQDEWIQPILGQQLYDKIMADIKASTLVAPYTDLVQDYIAKTEVWFTCYVGFPFWGVKIVNSGVMQRIVDDGSTVSFNDIDALAEKCRQKAEWYKQRLINYLCKNKSDFPEFSESGDPEPEQANYMSQLNLETYIKPKDQPWKTSEDKINTT